MLTEYSISPYIFDFTSSHDIFSCKKARLKSFRAFWEGLKCNSKDEPNVIVISNLFDGLWEQKVKEIIDKVREEENRWNEDEEIIFVADHLNNLLSELKEHKVLLHREKHDPHIDSPGDDEEKWVEESERLKRKSLIDQIVTARPMAKGKVFNLPDAVLRPKPPLQTVKPTIDDEMALLKPFLSRSNVIAITCPYIVIAKNKSDQLEFHKEYEFHKNIILYKNELDKKHKKQLRQVDLFINDNGVGRFPVEEVARKIKDGVHSIFPGRIRVFARKNVTERRLFFENAEANGDYTLMWTVAATHYARDEKLSSADEHTFSLLSPASSERCYGFYYDNARLEDQFEP